MGIPGIAARTLKFIGEQPQERVDEIQRALATVQEAPFEVTFRKTGFFPPSRSPRVFWIGVEAGERLRELALKVDEIVSQFGIEREKDYTPHLTLARARPQPSGKGRLFFPQAGVRCAICRQLQSELAQGSPTGVRYNGGPGVFSCTRVSFPQGGAVHKDCKVCTRIDLLASSFSPAARATGSTLAEKFG